MGYPVGYPMGVPPPPPPPGSTRRSIAQIRRGIRWYLGLLITTVVTDLIASTVFWLGSGLVGSPGIGVGFSGYGTGGPPPWYSGVLGVVSLLALVALVLLLLAWIEWRGGVKALSESGSEYGPAHTAEARLAETHYTYTLLSIVLGIVVLVVGGVALALYSFSQVIRSGLPPSAGGPSVSPLPEVGILILGLGAGIVAFLAYYYAGRSLVGVLRSLLAPHEQARLESGRLWLVVAGLLAPLGTIALPLGGLPLAGGLGLVSPLLAIVGMRQILSGYDAWLGPPGGFGPAPAGWPTPPAPPMR